MGQLWRGKCRRFLVSKTAKKITLGADLGYPSHWGQWALQYRAPRCLQMVDEITFTQKENMYGNSRAKRGHVPPKDPFSGLHCAGYTAFAAILVLLYFPIAYSYDQHFRDELPKGQAVGV